MSTQTVKKTAAGSASAGVLAIAPNSDQRISFWKGQMEKFLDEVTKLRCLSSLLNGQNEHNDINLSELCYLIDPSVDRLSEICQELLDEVFHKDHMAFLQSDEAQQANQNAEGEHDDQ